MHKIDKPWEKAALIIFVIFTHLRMEYINTKKYRLLNNEFTTFVDIIQPVEVELFFLPKTNELIGKDNLGKIIIKKNHFFGQTRINQIVSCTSKNLNSFKKFYDLINHFFNKCNLCDLQNPKLTPEALCFLIEQLRTLNKDFIDLDYFRLNDSNIISFCDNSNLNNLQELLGLMTQIHDIYSQPIPDQNKPNAETKLILLYQKLNVLLLKASLDLTCRLDAKRTTNDLSEKYVCTLKINQPIRFVLEFDEDKQVLKFIDITLDKQAQPTTMGKALIVPIQSLTTQSSLLQKSKTDELSTNQLILYGNRLYLKDPSSGQLIYKIEADIIKDVE